MKRFWIIFLSVLVLAGCAGDSAKKKAAAGAIQAWSGNIRGNIPAFLWFVVNNADSMLHGQLYYTNYPKPFAITILGNNREGFTFTEYDTLGNITGRWQGQLKGDSLTGNWSSAKSKKVLPFVLVSKDTVLNVDTAFTAGDITGGYEYHMPNKAFGEINVKQLDSTHIIFNALCVTGKPTYRAANINDDTLVLHNNKATYTKRGSAGTCACTLSFYKNCMVVEYANGAAECGFGGGAGVNGIFIKTSAHPVMGPVAH